MQRSSYKQKVHTSSSSISSRASWKWLLAFAIRSDLCGRILSSGFALGWFESLNVLPILMSFSFVSFSLQIETSVLETYHGVYASLKLIERLCRCNASVHLGDGENADLAQTIYCWVKCNKISGGYEAGNCTV